MNILPKKRWHVRTKENIARVRRDEAEAAENEKQIQLRAKLAEQEARVSFLRQRAHVSHNAEVDEPKVFQLEGHAALNTKFDDIFTDTGHVNFFKDLESGESKTGNNEEYEKEKREEKEGFEKKIGLLKYLGQDTLEATGGKPWYESSGEFVVQKGRVVSGRDETVDLNEEIGLKGKVSADPLTIIVKKLGPLVPLECSSSPVMEDQKPSTVGKGEFKKTSCRKAKKKHHHKSKKMKKKHKHRRDTSEHDSDQDGPACGSKRKRAFLPSVSSEKLSTLAKLREERLRREEVERKRAERLLSGHDPDGKDENTQRVLEAATVVQTYNSQFHPEIARQNKPLDAQVKYWQM